LGLQIIISHDFVENLLKTAEPTCHQPYTLWGEIYFLSSFQNLIVDSMVAYGYICRFKLETSSKDAKAHLGVLHKEMSGGLPTHACYFLNEDIIVSLISNVQCVVQRPSMNCFKNTICFVLQIMYSKTVEQILRMPRLVARKELFFVITHSMVLI
jgi:hypothetical protein